MRQTSSVRPPGSVLERTIFFKIISKSPGANGPRGVHLCLHSSTLSTHSGPSTCPPCSLCLSCMPSGSVLFPSPDRNVSADRCISIYFVQGLRCLRPKQPCSSSGPTIVKSTGIFFVFFVVQDLNKSVAQRQPTTANQVFLDGSTITTRRILLPYSMPHTPYIPFTQPLGSHCTYSGLRGLPRRAVA